MPDIHLRYSPEEFAELALEKYRSFVSEPTPPAVTVFESFPIQTHVRVLMQMGASTETITGFWDRLQFVLEPANPALVFFEDSDPIGGLAATMEMRGEEWTRYVVESLEQTPYAIARGLSSKHGVLQMLEAYAGLMADAVQSWRFNKLVLPARPASFVDRDKEIAQWVLSTETGR